MACNTESVVYTIPKTCGRAGLHAYSQVVVVIDPDEMMLRPLELLNRDLFYKETLFDSKARRL